MFLKSKVHLVTIAALYTVFPQTIIANQEASSTEASITVTGTREETLRAETSETVGQINDQELQATKPAHPSEIMERVPGVHINVTGGEGHMTSIRQPISTQPLYLYLEDGIPTRSTGFFNHNALYEVNVPQASGIEITKGPGTSLYGSDAIGGVINVITEAPPLEPELKLSLEAGEFGWKRLLTSAGKSWDDDGIRADINLTQTDGWRDATDYDRASATVRWDHFLQSGASLKTLLSTSNIDQQTAGSSRISEDDYNNNPTENYTPISYREVKATRLSTAYEKESHNTLLSLTPYVRNNFMEYMPNWSFSYDPSIKETESNSLGLLAKYRIDFKPLRTRLIFGADIDYTPGSRLEHSIDAVKTGDVYTSFTTAEKIYDYDVTYQAVSPYVHVETSPSENWRFNAGLRYDNLQYDYTNNMADGALVINPESTRFPVTYNHPVDAKVDFAHFSPKLGAAYTFNESLNGFASYRHAFRAPSEGQIFRPGSNDASLDLDPVKVDSFEIGLRGNPTKLLNYEVSIYYMTKKDDLVTYEDPVTEDRTTVNAGETLHRGIELGLNSQFSKDWKFSLSYAKNKHTFETWVERGTDFSGNEIQSAPEEVANTRINYSPSLLNGGRAELEWVHLGEYWMDQSNTQKYSGHELINLRMNYFATRTFETFIRLMNVTDKTYATSASFSRGESTFAPGMPRTLYAGAEYKF
ncbi:MAG: TonB-dependent receptor [Gammaproteobacteria bacterium]|nr:TonB-dependent receptor [Gammaproteobacteria bacterium]